MTRSWTALAAIGLLAGCASAPPPRAEAPPPLPPAPAAEPAAEAPAPEPALAEAPPPERAYGPQTVVIEPGGGEGEDSASSLADAAREERERRAQAGRPVAIITDKTLPAYATGELSMATSPPPAAPEEEDEEGEEEATAGGEAAGGGEAAAADEQGESYWRSRVLQARTRWKEATDQIERLEGEVAELRQRFYAADDPWQRDAQIKPAWDRALDQLQEARALVESSREALAAILEEGRRAGALPGWLREGIELEPRVPDEDKTFHDPAEPVVIDDGLRERRPNP